MSQAITGGLSRVLKIMPTAISKQCGLNGIRLQSKCKVNVLWLLIELEQTMYRVKLPGALLSMLLFGTLSVSIGCADNTVVTQQEQDRQAEKKQDQEKTTELKVGDEAPEFEVTGIDGEKFKLSDKIGNDGKNVVLLFSRANW